VSEAIAIRKLYPGNNSTDNRNLSSYAKEKNVLGKKLEHRT